MYTTSFVDALRKINIRCAEFISQPVPLYKDLPTTSYGDIDRVKVRFRREPEFSWLLDDLTQFRVSDRFVRTHTAPENYFVFPVDGARYVWSHTYPNLTDHLHNVVNTSGDIANVPEMRQQVVDQTRSHLTYSHLDDVSGASREVFVYNIPDFYVVRVDACPDYSVLLEAITSSNFAPIHYNCP